MSRTVSKYGQIMDRVEVPEQLIEDILTEQREKCFWEKEKKGWREKAALKFAFGLLRAAVTAVVVCVCFVFSMRVIAGSVPQVYELLYLISPETAQYFKPVQKVSENNGIRMEVVSAYVHENVAEVYITMEDLEGDRIDETIDLYDSYSIHRPFSAMGHCQRVGYDEETGKAMFLIRVTEWGDQKINDAKMTFSVREFMSHEQEYEYLPIKADLTQADREPELVGKWINGMGYGRVKGEEEEMISREDIRVLSPRQGKPIELTDENGERVVLEGIQLSGMAWSEGLLRIQIRIPDMFDNDHHGYLQLVDEDGEMVDYLYHGYYQEKEEGSYTSYQEFVFRVDEEDLGKYSLVGHLWVTGTHVEGPWQVTFPLEEAE